MNPTQLLTHFDRISEAPEAIPRLRRFILDLAVCGKLLEQDPNDAPASELLKRIREKSPGRRGKASGVRLDDLGTEGRKPAFQIPAAWAWVRLGGAIQLLSGQHLQPNEYASREGSGPPYITGPADFGPSGLVITRYALVRKAVATKGQILLTVKGAGVGKTAICDLPEVAISRQLMALTAVGWSQAYLLLVTHLLAGDLKEHARSLIPGISREDVSEFAFPLPPLAEQGRIVVKVGDLMTLCDQLETAQADRESRRDRLVEASLNRLNQSDDGSAKSPRRENATFHLRHLSRVTTRPEHIHQLRQTILNLAVRGRLGARDWPSEPEPLGAVARLQNGYAFRSEWFVGSGVRLLRNTNVSHSLLRWEESAFLAPSRAREFGRFQLAAGDVVLSLDRPFISTGTKVAFVRPQDLPCLLLQRVGRFLLTEERITREFLFLWLTSPYFNAQIDPGRSNGVPHVSSKEVESASIFVPSIAEQRRVVSRVEELMATCDRLDGRLTTTESESRRLADTLLRRALGAGA